MDGVDAERLEAKGVGDANAQRVSAEREMDELAQNGVVEILSAEGVLRFRNLLRRAPGSDPVAGVAGCGCGLGRQIGCRCREEKKD